MFTATSGSTNPLINQSSSTHSNLELTHPNELERGFRNEEGDAVSSDSEIANGLSSVEAVQQLHLNNIETTEDSYESVINRINQWRESISRNSENLTHELETNPILETIEISREETDAEIELNKKLRLLQELLNETNDQKDCLDDSDEEENETPNLFNFLIGEPDFKDILFLRTLLNCSDFYLNGCLSKSFGKCAHLLRTDEDTKEYFNNLPINSGKRLLKERFCFLKSWTTLKPRWNLFNSLSQAEDEEIHELVRDLLEQKTSHSTHNQSINADQSSALSGSSYGSISSYETAFESESFV